MVLGVPILKHFRVVIFFNFNDKHFSPSEHVLSFKVHNVLGTAPFSRNANKKSQKLLFFVKVVKNGGVLKTKSKTPGKSKQ